MVRKRVVGLVPGPGYIGRLTLAAWVLVVLAAVLAVTLDAGARNAPAASSVAVSGLAYSYDSGSHVVGMHAADERFADCISAGLQAPDAKGGRQRTSGFAAEDGGGEGTVQLFRSVDAGEFDSIASTGQFSTAPGQMEGKFFATTGEHAEQWGQLLHGGDAVAVETRIPGALADQLFPREGKLDGIGPAIYAYGEQLHQLNELMDGIRLWP